MHLYQFNDSLVYGKCPIDETMIIIYEKCFNHSVKLLYDLIVFSIYRYD